MPLVAIESLRRALVTVACLRIHGRNHPILGYPPRDAIRAVFGWLQILADHGRQQLRGLLDLGAEHPAIKNPQAGESIACP